MGFKLKFWFSGDGAPVAYVTQGAGSFGDLIATKLSREIGYPVTCHPDGAHVWRVTWFDSSAEVYCEGRAVLSCPTAPLRAWVARVHGVSIRLVEERCDHPRVEGGECAECGERCSHKDVGATGTLCHDPDCPIHGSV